MSEPLVSIVIPVYNVEKYVAECLTSVVNQSYYNLEIICVNDGSTDDSFISLEAFRQRDSRIKIINQSNQGLSCARNTGAKQATGEFIYFLDSDDAIHLELIERCVDVLVNNGADIVTFDADIINETGQKLRERYSRKKIVPPVKLLSGLAFLGFESRVSLQTSVPTYFFKRALLIDNDLSFYPQMTHEDVLFHFQLLALENIKISYLSKKLYRRRYRDNSIMTTAFAEKNVDGYLCVYQQLFKDSTHWQLKKCYCQPICSRFLRELCRGGYTLSFRWLLLKSITQCCIMARCMPLPFYELRRLYRKSRL